MGYPTKLGYIIRGPLRQMLPSSLLTMTRVWPIWMEVVGGLIGPSSAPVSIKDGVLTV
ncbi:MAG: hypothetical protein HQK60_09235, partial [Deltaproteobacteria bacterium]|nr:hypothetical protein [Deltaproteobacteria bacterium]